MLYYQSTDVLGGMCHMKRVVSLIFVVLLLGCSFSTGAAESYDLSELSDNALMKLYELLRQEMDARNLLEPKTYDLPVGKYIIGQDIMPGKYTLTCTATSGENLGNAYSSLGGVFGSLSEEDGTNYSELFGSLGGIVGDMVMTQVKIIGDYGTVIKTYEMKKDQTMQIILEEKTALQIEDGSCSLTPIK